MQYPFASSYKDVEEFVSNPFFLLLHSSHFDWLPPFFCVLKNTSLVQDLRRLSFYDDL